MSESVCDPCTICPDNICFQEPEHVCKGIKSNDGLEILSYPGNEQDQQITSKITIKREEPTPFRDLEKKLSDDVAVHNIQEHDLFSTVQRTDSDNLTYEVPKMLITGFGIRNLASLEKALGQGQRSKTRAEKQRQLEEERAKYEENERLLKRRISSKLFAVSDYYPSSSSSKSTSTSLTAVPSYRDSKSEDSKDRLQYSIGDSGDVEEHIEIPLSVNESSIPSIISSSISSAMREARKYLRKHKIFELFQFITAHMLSELPANPISFIIELLDKCILYRNELGSPPLLYDAAHLEQLFFLMDRMKTGYIEFPQYESGMRTLGICSYNKYPPRASNDLISRDTFVIEAYDCLACILEDMLRVRPSEVLASSDICTPPPSLQNSSTAAPTGFDFRIASREYYQQPQKVTNHHPSDIDLNYIQTQESSVEN